MKPYLIKNPTAMTALDLIRTHVDGPLCYDHFAFRTFGVRIILVLGFMIHMVFVWKIQDKFKTFTFVL